MYVSRVFFTSVKNVFSCPPSGDIYIILSLILSHGEKGPKTHTHTPFSPTHP